MQTVNPFAVRYIRFHPKAAAETIEKTDLEDAITFLNSLDNDVLELLLRHFRTYMSASYLKSLSIEKSASILDGMPAGVSAAILRTFEVPDREKILDSISAENRDWIKQQLVYLPATAGSLMDASVLPFTGKVSPMECAAMIEKGNRSHYYLYIVDKSGVLTGVTTMRRVLETIQIKTTLEKIADKNPSTVSQEDSVEEILANPAWAKFHSLPVVDHQNTFLGILRFSTLRELESLKKARSASSDSQVAGSALGELYSLGISAILGSPGNMTNKEEN